MLNKKNVCVCVFACGPKFLSIFFGGGGEWISK